MNKKLWAVLALVTIVAMVAVACGPTPTEAPVPPTEAPAAPTEAPPPAEAPAEKFRVAVVMPSAINDLAFSQSMYDALVAIQEEMGADNFEFAYSDGLFVVDDAAAAIRDYATQGYDLVIAHGSQYGSSLVEIAPDFPDTSFAWGTTVDTFTDQGINNVFAYEARSEEGGYVNGVIAASLSQSDVIGVIGPIETGDAKLYVDGFTAGVLATKPDATVNVNWTGSFSDVALASEAAQTHINAGADALTGSAQMVVGAVGVAEEKGVLWFGTQADQTSLAPDIVVACQVYDWTVALDQIIGLIQGGTLGGQAFAIDLANGGLVIQYNPDYAVPDEVKTLADETIQGITDGTIAVLGAPPVAEAVPVKELKAAFVYVAPIGDLGWTWAHEQGRLMVEEELGIETAYIENVPEGPDAERVIRDFAQKDYDLVFATSFGFMDPMVTVAGEFPDKYFEHCSGFKTADNMATYFGRMYQPRFLSGLVAGKATQTNKIGYVAAFPIPEVLRGINAFTLGVREANPEATVHVVWTNTWFDPVLEKEAAEALLDQGCDVIAQHQDTTEPQKAAQERGMVSIGYDSDMRQFVGDTVLTSPIWNWGPYYVERTKAVMDGTWETHQYWGGMKEGIVDLAPLSDKVPDDVKALVEEWKQKILSGEWDVFTGPTNGQNGELSIPAGVSMTDEEMLSMDWFVEGVVGEAPGEPPVAEAVAVEKPRVAFVYVGPVGDMGWTYAHDQGRLYLEKELGVETAYSELVSEGPDSTRVIRDYAEKGYNVIFATSFGYMDSVIEVAVEYPDTVFEHCTGYKTADNAGIYDGRGYQGWYLAGIVAGKMTKNNVLGYIAPYPIPEVVRNMNAFALGARSVNPDAEVHPVWIFDWVNPPKEREAAEALYDLGADVIARESDSTEADKLAQEKGIYAIGYNSDIVRDQSPDAFLTAPIWNWGLFYKKAVEDVMNGTWTNTPVWWGLKEGLLELAPIADFVPDDVKDLVEEKKAEIVAGEFDVFVGPIKDNTGELRVPEGETMTDEEKLAFDWLVEGVVGTIPE